MKHLVQHIEALNHPCRCLNQEFPLQALRLLSIAPRRCLPLLGNILQNQKDRCYSEKDAAIIVRQMLKFAAECHLHGLVDRDMKPENFVFKSREDDSQLKATDFGLSDFITPGLSHNLIKSQVNDNDHSFGS